MKQFLTIASWEFLRNLRSRSFFLATFVSPVIFAAFVLIAALFYNQVDVHQPHVIGCVELSPAGYCQLLSQKLNRYLNRAGTMPDLILVSIQPDTTAELEHYYEQLAELKSQHDSLDQAYNKIKQRRNYIFRQAPSRKREKLLRQTYEQLHKTREERDLAEIEYNRLKSVADSLMRQALLAKADSLLMDQVVEGYLVINPDYFASGRVEFHSLLPVSFLRIDPIRQVLQMMILEQRLQAEGISESKIQEWLRPVEILKFEVQGSQRREFNFLVSYLAPVIVVLFLFTSIFTSSGFLFNGVLSEKSNRVIELLLSSVSHTQLLAGKIVGLGCLGLFQILIWMGLTYLLTIGQVLRPEQVDFLTLKNAALFIWYFALGYLFYASIFVGIGSLFSDPEDAHHLNQFMRILSILPVALALVVVVYPNALFVRILSFIPFLTPTIMILRTPIVDVPMMDYLISSAIMVLSFLFNIVAGGKLFRVGSLMYGKKPSLKTVLQLLRAG